MRRRLRPRIMEGSLAATPPQPRSPPTAAASRAGLLPALVAVLKLPSLPHLQGMKATWDHASAPFCTRFQTTRTRASGHECRRGAEQPHAAPGTQRGLRLGVRSLFDDHDDHRVRGQRAGHGPPVSEELQAPGGQARSRSCCASAGWRSPTWSAAARPARWSSSSTCPTSAGSSLDPSGRLCTFFGLTTPSLGSSRSSLPAPWPSSGLLATRAPHWYSSHMKTSALRCAKGVWLAVLCLRPVAGAGRSQILTQWPGTWCFITLAWGQRD